MPTAKKSHLKSWLTFLGKTWVGNAITLLIIVMPTIAHYLFGGDPGITVDCVAIHLSSDKKNDIELINAIDGIISDNKFRICGSAEFEDTGGMRHLSVDYFTNNENIKSKMENFTAEVSNTLSFGKVFARKESVSGFKEYFTERRKIGLYLQP